MPFTPFVDGAPLTAAQLNAFAASIEDGTIFSAGAVKTNTIEDGSIKLEDLNQEVLDFITQNIPGLIGRPRKLEIFTLIDGETQVTLQFTPITDCELVWMNGLKLTPTIGYTISANIITLAAGYASGSKTLEIRYEHQNI